MGKSDPNHIGSDVSPAEAYVVRTFITEVFIGETFPTETPEEQLRRERSSFRRSLAAELADDDNDIEDDRD